MDILGCESSVAGSILISPSCLPLVSARLRPEDFALEGARAVYENAMQLSAEGGQIDAVTVQAKARERGISLSNTYLADLMSYTPTAANVESYIELVREAGLKRRVLELLQYTKELTEDGMSAENVIYKLSGAVSDLYSSASAKRLLNSAELFSVWGKKQLKKSESNTSVMLKTGFTQLDAILGGGMVKGGLYIIGGRPGIGKTTLALSTAMNIAREKKSVLFVSLEMSEGQIASKLISIVSLLPYSDVYRGDMEDEATKLSLEAASYLSKLPFYLCAKPRQSVSEIVMLARGIKDLAAVVIDYIGLISPPHGKAPARYELMTEVSGSLKRSAAMLEVPFLCAAQLNRDMSARKSKRPLLTDLRDSGSIEQDADGVILLHRPSYYDCEEWDASCDNEPLELIVAKNRHGTIGSCEMLFCGSSGRLYERKATGGKER